MKKVPKGVPERNEDQPVTGCSFMWTDTDRVNFLGLTKREYFAAAALQGLLARGHNMASSPREAVHLANETLQMLREDLKE